MTNPKKHSSITDQSKRKKTLNTAPDLGGSTTTFGSSFRASLLSSNSSFRTLGHEESVSTLESEWTCSACFYQNIDCRNSVCSVCGLDRDDQQMQAPELCSLSSGESSLTPEASREPVNQLPRGVPKRTIERSVSMESSASSKPPEITNADSRPSNLNSVRSSTAVDVSIHNFAQEPSSSRTTSNVPHPNKLLGRDKELSLPKYPPGIEQEHRESSCASDLGVPEPQKKHKFLSRSCVAEQIQPHRPTTEEGEWECGLCTYINRDPLHLTCSVCGHKRGHESSLRREGVENETCYIHELHEQAEGDDLKALKEKRVEELVSYQSKILGDLQGQRDSVDKQDLILESMNQLNTITMAHGNATAERERSEKSQQSPRHEALECEGRRFTHTSSSNGEHRSTTRSSVLKFEEHQRMLDDWKERLDARQATLDQIRRRQEAIADAMGVQASER